MFSLDANVLVYAADRTAGSRHAVARQIMQDAPIPGMALTEQTLFEFFHASTRKGKISVLDATGMVRDLLYTIPLLLPPQTVVSDALALAARYRLSIWDARLLSVCEAHGCGHVLSEDMQDGALYNMVRVVNPFAPKNAALVRELISP
jgi:predicted nucleic acid-binding protein